MVRHPRVDHFRLRAADVTRQEEIVDALDRIVVRKAEALAAVALHPTVAHSALSHGNLHSALRRRVEIATGKHQRLTATRLRDETHDRVGFLLPPTIDRRCVEMSVDHRQLTERTLHDHAQRTARLMRSARPLLRRIHRQVNERVLENRPARQDRDAVLPSVVVERAAERDVQPAHLCQPRRLVHVAGALRPLVDLLKQHEVRVRRPNQLGHAHEVVHTAGILASVNVVDHHAHRSRGRLRCRTSARAADKYQRAETNQV